MYYIKKLVLTILAVNILFGTNLSFRGNTKDQIIAQKIPLAFSNMILSVPYSGTLYTDADRLRVLLQCVCAMFWDLSRNIHTDHMGMLFPRGCSSCALSNMTIEILNSHIGHTYNGILRGQFRHALSRQNGLWL